MPDWFLKFMLFVFAVHFLGFAWLAARRRRLTSTLAASTFFLLFLAITIRLWRPESHLLGIRTYWYLRIPAWGMALASLTLSWRQHRRKGHEKSLTKK